jgi:iron complex outermembrane receptor protein
MAAVSILALIMAGAPAAAMAQTSSDETDARTAAVEEIVVTAEKRSINLQDTPVAVTAITAASAQSRGITGVESLSAAVPGLVINNPANVGNPFLRGIGSNLFDPSAEQAVAMYVDGVYIAAPQSNLFTFNNIKSVEVLRGPQGTLFGRNATGGVIHIQTRDPSYDPTGYLSVGYGNYENVEVSAYGATGLGSNVAIDFAGLYQNQGKGYGRNLTTGTSTFRQAIDNVAVRSKLLIEPFEGTKITLAGDFSHSRSNPAYQNLPGFPRPIDPMPYPGRFNSRGNLDNSNNVKTGGVSLRIGQEIGDLNLLSITAYRKTRATYDLDQDGTRLSVADAELAQHAHNWSQEFQISGPDGGWLKWVAGLYYYRAVGGYSSFFLNGRNRIRDHQDTESYAAFGQATASLFEGTNLTVGMRYTDEKQDFTLEFPASLRKTQKFSKFTYRITLDHHFNDDIMGYVSHNTGFKSGGYNLLDAGGRFEPEVLYATEAGLKTQLFDRRLRLNLAAFHYVDKNVQLLLTTVGGTVVTNAAAAEINGGEVEFELVPVSDLSITGGISVLHGRYTDFPGAVPLNPAGVPQPPINARGNRTVMTPDVTANLNMTYRWSTPVGDIRPSISATYNDGFAWQSDNRLKQPSYAVINGSLTWSPEGEQGGYDIRLWAKNLTDTKYYIARITSTGLGDAQQQASPRTYGITLAARF